MSRGGKRPGAGRPAPLGPRTARLAVRLTPDELAWIQAAADAADLAPSEFVRDVVRLWLTESTWRSIL